MNTVAEDPTMEFLATFDQPELWSVKRGVPAFDEHDEYDLDHKSDSYGQLLRTFGPKELQEIADACNEREADGDLCPLTDGHIKPELSEKEQPEILGYARNFRVGRYGPKKKLGILYDAWIYRNKVPRANQLPRRSPEYFPRDKVFDPIAMLIRTPQRNLGTVTNYQTASECIRYAARKRPQGTCLHYSMEDSEMDDMKPKVKVELDDDPKEKEVVDVEDEFNPLEKAAYARACAYMAKHDKVYGAMKAKYDADNGGDLDDMPASGGIADPADDDNYTPEEQAMYQKMCKYMSKHDPIFMAAAGPGEPGGTNTFEPKLVGAGSPVPEKPAKDMEVERMNRNDKAIQYARERAEVAELKATVDVLKKERDQARKGQEFKEYETTCVHYQAQGYTFKTADVMETLRDLPTPVARKKYIDKLPEVLKYSRSPGGSGIMREVASTTEPSMTEDEQRKIVRYASKNGITDFDLARKQMNGKA